MLAAAEAQRRARENAAELRCFLAELRGWERRLERADREERPREPLQEYPPIRNKPKKPKTLDLPSEMETRISSDNYSAWEKYDVNKACENIDNNEASKPSLDSVKSEDDKDCNLRMEAQHEKERGNSFVQLKKWDEAIACYTNAINIYDQDATFYANRALCHLKKDNLHAAEADCTAALKINPTYIKALLRRSTALEGLGSLRRAGDDLGTLLQLEPGNNAVRRQLGILITRMGTKGKNFKSSPTTPEDQPNSPFQNGQKSPTENVKLATQENQEKDEIPKTQDKEVGAKTEQAEINISENSEKLELKKAERSDLKRRSSRSDDVVIQAIVKPPHLRSRKPLVRVSISEIPKGSSVTAISPKTCANELTKTVIKHINKKSLFKPNNVRKLYDGGEKAMSEPLDFQNLKRQFENFKYFNPEIENSLIDELTYSEQKNEATLKSDNIISENYVNEVCGIPKSSLQFIADWRLLKGRDRERSAYLSAIPPSNLTTIFKNSMECDVLSDILHIICTGCDFVKEKGFAHSMPYLIALTNVQRFSALAMFLSKSDKEVILNILKRCTEQEKISEEQRKEIMNKYEI